MKNRVIILGLGLVFVIASLFILSSVQFGRADPALTPSPLPFQIASAKQAYAQLEQWNKTWAPDAGIVAGSTSIDHRRQQADGWTFQIYSPSTQRLALVMVEDQKIRVLKEMGALYPQVTIAPDAWRIDSDEFLTRWWKESGRAVWQLPQAQTLYLHLGSREDGFPSWQATVMSEGGTMLNYWEIRADTGDPFATIQSGGNQ